MRNKSKAHILLFILMLTVNVLFGQIISIRGNQFIDENEKKFYPMVMNYEVELAYNYLPISVDNIYIQRASQVGETGYFCCGGIDSGMFNIEQDFYEIVNLGFNTIRLIFKPRKIENKNGFYLKIEEYPTGIPIKNIKLYIYPPYDPNVNREMAMYLDKLLSVIQLANKLGLKVICPLAEDSYLLLMKSNQNDYLSYIATVSKFINQHNIRNILAYEFIGEPTYAVNNDIEESKNTKCDICKITNAWINCIEQNDSGRMTTIGTTYFDDPFFNGWDPVFLNVDFFNIHLYPTRSEKEFNLSHQYSLDNSIQRYVNNIYRYDLKLNKPFIIGETAFFAEDPNGNPNLVFPYAVLGNEADQKYFVDKTLGVIYNKSKALGYGWWLLNNYHYSGNPNPSIPPDELQYTLHHYAGDHSGLLRHGDPTNDLLAGWAIHRKKATEFFIKFKQGDTVYDSSLQYGPTSELYNCKDIYFNPSLIKENNFEYVSKDGKEHFGYVKGYVIDQFGYPIQGAIIKGADFDAVTFSDDSLPQYHLRSVETFSDINGYFEIYVEDMYPNNDGHSDPILDKTFDDLKISAFGCLPIERGWNGQPINGYETFILYSLNSKIKHEQPGQNIYNSKEVNCSEIEELEKSRFINQNFPSILVFPNPSTGIFYFTEFNNPEIITTIIIYNSQGECVENYKGYNSHFRIDLSNYPIGIYLAKIITTKEVQTSKIIIR